MGSRIYKGAGIGGSASIAGVPLVPAVVLFAGTYLATGFADSLTGIGFVIITGGAIFALLRAVAAGDPQAFRAIGVGLLTRFVWHPALPSLPGQVVVYAPLSYLHGWWSKR